MNVAKVVTVYSNDLIKVLLMSQRGNDIHVLRKLLQGRIVLVGIAGFGVSAAYVLKPT